MGIIISLNLLFTEPNSKIKPLTMARKAAKEASPVKEASPAKEPKKQSGITKPMKLSADLAAIVGKKEASRAECIKELWVYLKKNNLQDAENRQYFTPDKKMAKVFGSEKIRGFGMAKFLGAHLTDL